MECQMIEGERISKVSDIPATILLKQLRSLIPGAVKDGIINIDEIKSALG